MYADIILPLPLDGLFTYSVPAELNEQAEAGRRVLVPFGRNKSYVGIIAKTHHQKPAGFQVKDILQVLDAQPILLPAQYRLWSWIADYYMSPIGEVYKAALPAGLKAEDGYKPRTETFIRLTPQYRNEPTLHVALNMLQRAPNQLDAFTCYLALSRWDSIEGNEPREPILEITREELMNVSGTTAATLKQLEKKGMLETYEVEVGRLNHGGEPDFSRIKQLSQAQQQAYNQILFSFLQKDVTLLHGVTSSGKTEIYIHLIKRELDRHHQVLYLLPEIALTVQMMERLRSVFGSRLGIYHSKYSDAERVEIWQKQLSANPYDIILGARSAVFLPFQRLGLIIVDEEHETSYKQQDPAPRYHARSVAIMLPHLCGEGMQERSGSNAAERPKVLLGTATPSMESYFNARSGKYALVELTQRYKDIELPEIQVVDTADLQRRKMMNGPFSPTLLLRVREALQRGEQAILFQNRRGWAPMIECNKCGWVPRCQHCDVSLTLHKNTNQLTCHYCGYTYQVPTECPACGSKDLRSRGYGTEKVEDHIRQILPEARIARMDLDTTRTRNAYERIISDFSRRAHQPAHRHADDFQGPRLRPRRRGRHPRCRLDAQLPRLPRLRACLYDDGAGERTRRTQGQARPGHPADQATLAARHPAGGRQRLSSVLSPTSWPSGSSSAIRPTAADLRLPEASRRPTSSIRPASRWAAACDSGSAPACWVPTSLPLPASRRSASASSWSSSSLASTWVRHVATCAWPNSSCCKTSATPRCRSTTT